MDLSVSFKGFDEIEKALRTFPAKIVKKALVKSLKKGARVILKDAKKRVPVRTGNLKKSLAVRSLPKKAVKNRTVVEIWARTGKKSKYDGWYANLVEFGTQRHLVKGSPLSDGKNVFGSEVEVPSIPAQPFMRPALDTKANEAVKVAGETLSIELEKLK